MWNNHIYTHAKNQKRSRTVPEVMAECPLRGHPNRGTLPRRKSRRDIVNVKWTEIKMEKDFSTLSIPKTRAIYRTNPSDRRFHIFQTEPNRILIFFQTNLQTLSKRLISLKIWKTWSDLMRFQKNFWSWKVLSDSSPVLSARDTNIFSVSPWNEKGSSELFCIPSISQLPLNRGKNRYINILPNEPTRVRLQGLPNDFINANRVTFNSGNKYIATQGESFIYSATTWQYSKR